MESLKKTKQTKYNPIKTKENGKEKKRQERKQTKGKEKRGRRKTTYSLPSLHEQSETPGALDRCDWESQETPVAQNRPFSFSPH